MATSSPVRGGTAVPPRLRHLRLQRGLDLPLAGAPRQQVEDGEGVSRVALLPGDVPGLEPTLLVEQGQAVRTGEPILADRHEPAIVLLAPGRGTVVAIHRGPRRALLSVVIELEEPDGHGAGDDEQAEPLPLERLERLSPATARQLLLERGLWASLRVRPGGGIPRPSQELAGLVVPALDTRPGAPDPRVVLADEQEAWRAGLTVLGRLGAGPLFVCATAGSPIPGGELRGVTPVEVTGPHPAGLPGTLVHHLLPAGRERAVAHMGWQDVLTLGHTLTSGRACLRRVVALAGPLVARPRLLATRVGAALGELLRDELLPGPHVLVSGSPLEGRRAAGPLAYLGAWHDQLTVLRDGGTGDAAGARPRWSLHPALPPGRRRAVASSAPAVHPGPLLPLPAFERVLPLDLLPVPLLRAVLCGDDRAAEDLGCLELVEEDLALCAFVCAARHDYGAALRATLQRLLPRP